VKKILLVLSVLLLVAFVPGSAESATRAKWNTRVFSRVPNPGFPAYVYLNPSNNRVYAGTYTNPNGDKVRSRVMEWTSGGTLLRSWTVPGQDLAHEHGVQVATSDARGRLVLLEKSTSSILTLDVKTGKFQRQAVLPDLPTCKKAKGKVCSPNGSDEPAIPNYASWGPDGALYVTDYGQAVIWRIPAAGGTPKVWFASDALDSSGYGTTGIVYRPAQHDFLIGQQTTSQSNPLSGRIYRLPITRTGAPGAISTLWRSSMLALPDGFGVARSGRIFVADLLQNQIVELSPAGKVIDKFPKSHTGGNGSSILFDGPSNATFLGTRILVANQSPVLGTTSHHAILDVEVGELGAAAYVPKKSVLK
jgi:sugar lactone lactonase YvrE